MLCTREQRQPVSGPNHTLQTLADVAFKQTLARCETGPGCGAALSGGEHWHPPGALSCLCRVGHLTYAYSQAAAMPLPRFVVNERDATGGDREGAEQPRSSESEQDEEADVTDAEEEDDCSDAEEPQQEAGLLNGRQTALPRSVPAEEAPRAKLTFKLKKQRASDEVCHVCLLGMQAGKHIARLLSHFASWDTTCILSKIRLLFSMGIFGW